MRSARFARSVTEALEPRRLFSHVLPAADPIATAPIDGLRPIVAGTASPATANASAPYTPALVRSAYGIGSISFNGTSGTGAGETIAIIDAYNDPKILADANYFSNTFSLPQFDSNGGPTLTVLGQTGSTTLPANSTSSNGGWDVEEALDVEWAHAVAPSASIVLYEANSASLGDLTAAASTAADAAGVSVVSMSFGSTEFSAESYYDSTFLTPSGHQGVTFLASTGDDDAPAEYPAYSPNVVAVGGTSLTLSSSGTYVSESAWGNTSTGVGGGGGVSSYESQPSYQSGHVNNLGGTSSPKRTAPDVSFDADPGTGVFVYDSYYEGSNNGGYYSVGGTSLACPMWAGLVAIANQGRAASGLGTLNGKTQVLPTLYTLGSGDYHDITTGNDGFAAGPGYDLATGLGTPVANVLVPQLATLGATGPGVGTHLVFSAEPPSTTTAGTTFNLTVDVLDANGNLATGDAGTVTLSLTGNTAALNGSTTATVSSGIASFTGMWITQAGSGYTLAAAESSMTGVTSTGITITPADASELVFTAQPTATTVNAAMNSAVTVDVEDTYGNVVTTDSSSVTLTLSSNDFRGGSTTRSATDSAGVASFTAVAIAAAGSYTIAASDGSLSSATSASFTVGKATPTISATVAAGTYNGSAQGLSAATAVDANTAGAVGTWGDGSITVAYYAGATQLSSAPTNAGSYTAVVNYDGSSNYNAASSTIPFGIAARVLHVSAVAQNKAYDRTTTAAVTLSDDRLAGDAFTINTTGANFATIAAGNNQVVTVAGLSLSGGVAADYALAAASITTAANITPLNVTGSIAAADKTYDGTTAAVHSAAALTGELPGDNVALTGTATFASKYVGTGQTVTATLSLIGSAAGDYVLTNPSETATASITPRSVTPTITAASKIYDGTTTASLTSQSLTNAVPGDALSMQISGTSAFNSKDVQSATTVTIAGISLAGADAANYLLTATTAAAPATIAPLPVTGGVLVANKIYDSTTAASISARILSGGLAGDDVSLTGGVAAFATAKVAANQKVTVTQLSLTGASADDYTLSNPTETTTASITPMTLTGTVFGDTHLDGIDDAGDPGLAGRTVYLELPGRGTHGAKATKTNAAGTFTFANVAAGSYVVALAAKPGWRATTAVSQPVTLAPGGTATGIAFGQTHTSTVAGTVFVDSAAAINVSPADISLAGIILTLTGTGHSAGMSITATTTAAGTFTFTAIPAGTYKLTLTPSPGLTLSRHSAKSYALNLTAARTLLARDFGEEPITTASVAAPHRRAA